MKFNHERLTLARARRGMTQTHLATRTGLTAKSIRRYEAGEQIPTLESLAKLAEALRFPVGFFLRENTPNISRASASFRSVSTTTKREVEAVLAAGAIALELTGVLNEHLTLPATEIPDLRGSNPERAAEELRAEWGRGNKPIQNMVRLLEAKGVRVFSLVNEFDDVDAFCVTKQGVPFVFLSTTKSAERSRWDCAHELGHLVMHQEFAAERRTREMQANQFAGAFLMPKDDVLAHVPTRINIDAILQLKTRWGVSAMAMARRLHDMGLLGEFHYKHLCVEMSRLGYRKREPAPMQREQSELLKKAFEALRSIGLGRQDLADALRINVADLDGLVFGLTMVPMTGEGSTSAAARPALRLLKGGNS